MTTPVYYPYRSEEARDFCFSYLDSFASTHWPAASEDRTIQTIYGPTFVRISGPPDAPPLVLLHGAASNSLMWAPNIEALSAAYRTFAVDQICDFGKSLCTRPLSSFGDLIAWLDQLFDAPELRAGINLVGISYGGALAAQYALHAPARLAKVILLAPGNTVLPAGVKFWAHLIPAIIDKRRGFPAFFRWIFADMERNDPKWVETIAEQLSINMRNLQRRKTPMPPVLTDAEWRAFQVPALFLVGEHDVIYSAQKAVRRLQRVAPQIIAEIVPGAGNDFTVAHAETVDRRILEFLGKS